VARCIPTYERVAARRPQGSVTSSHLDFDPDKSCFPPLTAPLAFWSVSVDCLGLHYPRRYPAHMQAPSEVVEREHQFYNAPDRRYSRWRRFIWRAIGAFNRNSEVLALFDARGKRVLVYGCGPANEAKRLVDAGALFVSGIDISEAEVAVAWRQAHEGRYADRVAFRAGDAHDTGYPDGSFDLVVGSAIIHHLDIPRALPEIRRILAPGGRAVFLEPLAHNPLLRFGRWLTPGARTADEHPITTEDWQSCAAAFPGFWHREVELISIPLMPVNMILPRRWQEALARPVRAIDDWLLACFPSLRRFARTTFLVLE
jgi:SAM-dependent methyltransferase